jgi:GntR family transcriptional regulator/MocR family aminotransferase
MVNSSEKFVGVSIPSKDRWGVLYHTNFCKRLQEGGAGVAEGHFARHIRRMREIYAERLGVLLEESRRRLDGLLEISSVEAGLQTAGWLRGGIDAEAAAAAAAKRNVDVTPLARYSHGGAGTAGLQLGFAALDPTEIRRGVRDLAVALETLRKAPPG